MNTYCWIIRMRGKSNAFGKCNWDKVSFASASFIKHVIEDKVLPSNQVFIPAMFHVNNLAREC